MFRSPAHDCPCAVDATDRDTAQAASAESVVSEQNPLNKRSDLKDLKLLNPESWPVVMCESSKKDR